MIVLMGIVLFAALSYAVTKSMRGGGDFGNSEKSSIMASDILTYSNSVANTVKALMATNGCTDTTISFENPTVSGYANSLSPTDKSCNVFDTAGGGLTWQLPNLAALDKTKSAGTNYDNWHVSRNTRVNGAGASDTAPGGNDLIMIAPYLTKDVCLSINKSLGYNGIQPSGGGVADTAKFTGVYQATSYAIALPSQSLMFAGCGSFATGTYVGYVYYRVLIAR